MYYTSVLLIRSFVVRILYFVSVFIDIKFLCTSCAGLCGVDSEIGLGPIFYFPVGQFGFCFVLLYVCK